MEKIELNICGFKNPVWLDH